MSRLTKVLLLLVILAEIVLAQGIVINRKKYFDNLGGGGAYNTDSLKMSYLFTDLADGTVLDGEWETEANTYPLSLFDNAHTKSSSGVTSSGSGFYYVAIPFAADSSMTIEMVFNLSDSTVSSFSLADAALESTYDRYFGIYKRSGALYASGVSGTQAWSSQAYMLPLMGTDVHIVATWNGEGSTPKFYFNNVDVTRGEGTTNYKNDGNYLRYGAVDDEPPANSIVKYFAFFTAYFDSTRVGTHYNSSKIQDLLP